MQIEIERVDKFKIFGYYQGMVNDNAFDTAPTIPAKSQSRKKSWAAKGGGNVYMLLAVFKNRAKQFAEENAVLRAENEQLKATLNRLQTENDALWEHHRQQQSKK